MSHKLTSDYSRLQIGAVNPTRRKRPMMKRDSLSIDSKGNKIRNTLTARWIKLRAPDGKLCRVRRDGTLIYRIVV